MTKKNIIIIFIYSIVLSLFLFACGAVSERSYDEVYYGVYGEWLILPENDGVEVFYADGEEATVEANRVFIDDEGDFRVVFKSRGKKTKSTIKVNVKKQPALYVSKNLVYGTVNTEVALPKAVAHDGVNEIPVTAKLYFGETEISLENGFTPTQTGHYEYVLQATGKGGSVAEKTVPVYVEENAWAYADKIASFDKPYGENQLAFASHKAHWTDEIKCDEEDGSLCVNVSQGGDLNLINLDQYDVSEYDAVCFYVYKDCDVDISLTVSWGFWSESFNNHQWTKVLFEVDKLEEYIQEGYNVIKENVTTKNINGLHMALSVNSYEDYVYADDAVYFSSIRGIKKADLETINENIESILARGSVRLHEVAEIEYQYSKLTSEQQAQVKKYGDFQRLKIAKILADQGVAEVPDKVTYFDNQIGLMQISQPWSDFEMSITDEKTYNDESVLKIHVTKEMWEVESAEVCFHIDQPFVYDLSEYDYITFAVYFEHDNDLILYNDDWKQKVIGIPTHETLKAGEWNVVKLALGDMIDIQKSIVWIIEEGWNKTFGRDVDFYFSSIYAGKGNDNLDGYKLPFDEETGVEYLSSFNNVNFEYTTEVKYGDEAGSTKFYPGSNAEELAGASGYTSQLYAYIENASVKSFDGNAVFKTHVYYDGNMDQTLYILPKGYYDLTIASKTKLKKGEWTEVFFYLPEGKLLSDYGFMVMDEVAGWEFAMNEAVYFSAMTFERYHQGENIPFDMPYGYAHVNVRENAKVEYTTAMKYGEEEGSLKVSVSDTAREIRTGVVSQLYMDIVNTVESKKNSIFKMYAYYMGENDYSLYIMRKGYYYKEEATEYPLSGDGWSEIEFLLQPGDDLDNYSIVIMNDDWEFFKGDELYLSAFKCVGAADVSGIPFDGESGVEALKSIWNAQFSYSTEMKHGEEMGSTCVSASEEANGKQLYVNFECDAVVCLEDTNFKFYVYNDGTETLSLYVMRNNYWNTDSALSVVELNAGEWTEVTFTLPAGKTLDDYSLMIMDKDGGFKGDANLYLSALVMAE